MYNTLLNSGAGKYIFPVLYNEYTDEIILKTELQTSLLLIFKENEELA